MFRSKAEILRGLDPTDPASIQALIDFHRRTFGGFVMVEDNSGDAGKGAQDGKGGNTDQGKQDATGDGKDDGDKPLGPNGEKALQAERDARQALEAKVKHIEAETEKRNKALLEAFGIKTEDAKSEDAVTALQEKFTNLQHDLLVERVAREHKITDADDLALLGDIRDEAAMTKLAARLAKSSAKDDGEQEETKSRRFPKQDSSQGKGGSGEGKPSSVAEVMEARRQARAAKEQRSA